MRVGEILPEHLAYLHLRDYEKNIISLRDDLLKSLRAKTGSNRSVDPRNSALLTRVVRKPLAHHFRSTSRLLQEIMQANRVEDVMPDLLHQQPGDKQSRTLNKGEYARQLAERLIATCAFMEVMTGHPVPGRMAVCSLSDDIGRHGTDRGLVVLPDLAFLQDCEGYESFSRVYCD